MYKIEVKNKNNESVKEIELPEEIFSYPVKKHLIWEVVKAFLANRRKGSASTKTRGEVRGGGRKPWRQKGRGTARAGSNRSPLWRHGGTTFGPKPRDYYVNIPKRMKKNALKSAIAAKYRDNEMIVIDDLSINTPKTKTFNEIIKKFDINSVLIVDSKEKNENFENLYLASRNIPKVKCVSNEEVNLYDVVKYKNIMFSEEGLKSFLERIK